MKILSLAALCLLILVVQQQQLKCKVGFQPGPRGCIPANNPCPAKCNCNGYSAAICTSCKDPNAESANQCKTCKFSYRLNSNGKCVFSNPYPSCPSQCKCFIPGVCFQCKDPKTTLANNCLPASQFPPMGGCPIVCVCNGVNPGECTRCIEAHKTLSSGCKQCEANYTLSSSGQCVWNVSWCPEHCVCSGIVAGCAYCKVGYVNVQQNCTQCATGYIKDSSGQCMPKCMPNCECTKPGTCERCVQNVAEISTNCTTCRAPLYMNEQGQCSVKLL